jgi:hypothetical protein
MGWRLVEEILDHAPDMKYREFRVLVAFAASARDSTRYGMPGEESLALKANCGVRTVERAMASLQRRGILKQIARQSPGRRAVYALMPLLSPDSMLSGEENGDTRQHAVGWTPDKNEITPDSVSVGTPVSTPVTVPSVKGAAPQSPLRDDHDASDHVADDRDPSLSGADRNQSAGPYARARAREGSGPGQESPMTTAETQAEAKRQADALWAAGYLDDAVGDFRTAEAKRASQQEALVRRMQGGSAA